MINIQRYIDFMDDAPLILKLLLSLPVLNTFWGVYRIIKGVRDNNLLLLIIGIIWAFSGWLILWVIDLISTIIYKRPIVFVD